MVIIDHEDYLASTLAYYNEHATEYVAQTFNANLQSVYDAFTALLPPKASILDVGCGSGRDLLYFQHLGLQADGLEYSEALCKLLQQHKPLGTIYHADIRCFLPPHPYDALWCCAYLLHLQQSDILNFFANLAIWLKKGGYLFLSVKQNISTGLDSKLRYFTNFDIHLIEKIIAQGQLTLVQQWQSSDSLARDDITWCNMILQYQL